MKIFNWSKTYCFSCLTVSDGADVSAGNVWSVGSVVSTKLTSSALHVSQLRTLSRSCKIRKTLNGVQVENRRDTTFMSVIESRDLVSVSSLVWRPSFASLGLKLIALRL